MAGLLRPRRWVTALVLLLGGALLTGCGGGGSPPAPTVTSSPTPASSVSSAAARMATVQVYPTDDGAGSALHLRAVEEGTGTVIVEAIGSDPYDPSADVPLPQWTTMRQALLVQLCTAMSALGWTQVGTGPQWYDVRFSGGPGARTATYAPVPPGPDASAPPEPAPTSEAPGPAPDGEGVDDLLVLVGRPFEDPAVTRLVQACGYGDDVHASANVVCVRRGFELTLASDLTVQSVTVFNAESDGFSQYAGELPLGLTWDDGYADVLARLGQPEQVLGGNGVEIKLLFTSGSRSVEITLTATHDWPEQLAVARMHTITLSIPQA